MRSSRYILKRVIIGLLCLAIGGLCGAYYSRNNTQRQLIQMLSRGQAPSNKLEATLELIDRYYLDSISIDTLVESMMPKLIEELDPHSSYIPARDLSRVNESLDGEFDGIGVVFNMATDTVIVLNVIAAGPSAKAGVLARDRIIEIDGELVAGRNIPQDSIVGRLRGTRGTKVMLGIERGGLDELVDIEVTRGKIPIHSVTTAFMIKPQIGYLRLAQFARTTYKEFVEATNRLKVEGMNSLILDLRGNPGGFMDQAILLSNEFLADSTLIVYTEDKLGNQEMQYSNRDGQLQDLELVVLIDEGSASSSEIVAGALQDNDKGTIIGRRSFGKGLVQSQIPFNDGSAIRLTIARYYTPSGRSIQKPYELGKGEDYGDEILERIKHDELFTADSIAFDDSLRFVTPKGRVVYGGGGIMPDIFIPLSTDKLPDFVVEIARRNVLYNYTIKYSDRHRDALAAVETLSDLDALFDNDTNLLSDFIAYAAKEGVKASPAEIKASKDILKLQLRAYIGRNTKLEDCGYYANIYTLDDALMKALELLHLPTPRD